MKKHSSKNQQNGFLNMKPDTRAFFLRNFYHSPHQMNSPKAAEFFGVSTRTIQNWWRTGCPNWVDKYVELYMRAIPDTKAWDGFRFGHDGRFYTPYTNLHFSPGDILAVFELRQLSNIRSRKNEKLNELLDTLRSEEEVEAIREEIEHLVNSLRKIQQSPMLADRTGFSKPVARKTSKTRIR